MIIREATIHDAEVLAQAHQEVFPSFFLSTLGSGFLRTYYKQLIKFPETICYISEEDGAIIGYIVGRKRAKDYLKRVVKYNPVPFLWEGFKLIFTRPKALTRLVKNLDKKNTVDSQDYAEVGLIGVSPVWKGKGIGHALFSKMEECLRIDGISSISLTTDYYDNENTLRAYKAWGFNVLYEFTAYPNRKMYRLIKTIS